MIYIIVAFLLIAARVIYAGKNLDGLFYREPRHYEDKGKRVLQEENVFQYCLVTFIGALLWPIVLPIYGLFLLGRKLSKS